MEGVICLLAVLIVVLIIDTRVSGATNFDKVRGGPIDKDRLRIRRKL